MLPALARLILHLPLSSTSIDMSPSRSSSTMSSTAAAQPSRPQFIGVEVERRRRSATRAACANCRRRKQRCEPSEGDAAGPCQYCRGRGLECVRGTRSIGTWLFLSSFPQLTCAFLVRAPALIERTALPADDLVPEVLPDLPVRGNHDAPLWDLMSWRAELLTAHYAFRDAAYDRDVALAAQAAAEAQLRAALETIEAANSRVANATARVANEIERRRVAWEHFQEVQDDVGPRALSPVPVPAVLLPSGVEERAVAPEAEVVADAPEGDWEEFGGFSGDESEVGNAEAGPSGAN